MAGANWSMFGEIRGYSYCPNLLSVKRIFEYVKDLLLGSTLQKCSAPAQLILWFLWPRDHRLTSWGWEWGRILSDQVKCWLLPGFYLGFLFGGKPILKKFLSHAAAIKKFFRPSRGSGACSPGKFWKYSVRDWLKSYFWTLVTFTDSLKSSSKKPLFKLFQ